VELFPFETISRLADGECVLIPAWPQNVLQEKMGKKSMIFFIITNYSLEIFIVIFFVKPGGVAKEQALVEKVSPNPKLTNSAIFSFEAVVSTIKNTVCGSAKLYGLAAIAPVSLRLGNQFMLLYIANRVTTVFALSARPEHFTERNEIIKGNVIGPSITLAFLIDGGEGSGNIANTRTDDRVSTNFLGTPSV